MQKITPFLWFDSQAEEAANFYTSIFKNSKIGTVSRYGEVGPGPKGTVMLVTFQLDGEEFMAPIRCGLRNESGRARRAATPILATLRPAVLFAVAGFVICHLSSVICHALCLPSKISKQKS